VSLPAPPEAEIPKVPEVPVVDVPEARRDPPKDKLRPATVRFITKPWAKVTVDGEVLGTTPVFQATELSPGKHTLVFDNPAFKAKTLVVELKSGEQRDVRVQLEK
jgi:hypothetical protein